jgi:hypothetical protein
MSGAQGGLLMILAAVVLFVLWTRGYLASWLGSVTTGLSGTTAAKPLVNPIAVPGAVGARTTHAGQGGH